MNKLPDCPQCGEDELWRAPNSEQIRCYLCGWDSTSQAASSLALSILQQSLANGKSISIPSLGITIEPQSSDDEPL